MSEFVASRRIGEATISLICDGTLTWSPRFAISADERRRALPDADAGGRITIAFIAAHVRLGGASIIIDPGFDDPGTSFDREFAARWSSLKRTPGIRAGLAQLHVDPAAVTHVLITHAHDDHFAGVVVERQGSFTLRFPKARHLMGHRDYEENPARQQSGGSLAVRLGLVERAGLLDLVDGPREVVPGVTVIPTPGETPGHLAVRVASGGGTFYYVGDLFHHPAEVEHPGWAPPNRDLAALRPSRERLYADAASSGATVVFAHNRFPPWGKIVRASEGYRWEQEG